MTPWRYARLEAPARAEDRQQGRLRERGRQPTDAPSPSATRTRRAYAEQVSDRKREDVDLDAELGRITRDPADPAPTSRSFAPPTLARSTSAGCATTSCASSTRQSKSRSSICASATSACRPPTRLQSRHGHGPSAGQPSARSRTRTTSPSTSTTSTPSARLPGDVERATGTTLKAKARAAGVR